MLYFVLVTILFCARDAAHNVIALWMDLLAQVRSVFACCPCAVPAAPFQTMVKPILRAVVSRPSRRVRKGMKWHPFTYQAAFLHKVFVVVVSTFDGTRSRADTVARLAQTQGVMRTCAIILESHPTRWDYLNMWAVHALQAERLAAVLLAQAQYDTATLDTLRLRRHVDHDAVPPIGNPYLDVDSTHVMDPACRCPLCARSRMWAAFP